MAQSFDEERTGWDSNPRYRYRYTGFRDRLLQPLGHLSSRTAKGKRAKRDASTLWSISATSVREEIREELPAGVGSKTAEDLRPMVEAWMADDVPY